MINLKLTKDEAELLMPQLKSGYAMDQGDPQDAPENATKNWKSMIKKLKEAMKAKESSHG